jgi:hypothetical protein
MFDDLGYPMLSFITTALCYNPNKLRANPLNVATITFLAIEPDHSGAPDATWVLPCFSVVLFLLLWYFTLSMTSLPSASYLSSSWKEGYRCWKSTKLVHVASATGNPFHCTSNS